MASAALAATKAAGLKPNVVFVPRPSASPAEVQSAKASGVVTPLYTGSPAPMGLAYFGLSAGVGNKVVASVLNTTSLEATVSANATGIQAADLFQSSPDSYGIQLNAVLTNVTLFGGAHYQFWTQNVIEYYPATHVLYLITNVWNFSGGPLSANVFYAHGPYGTQVGTEYYYAELVVPFPVYYPFNLTLNMTSSVASQRDHMGFGVALSSTTYPSEDFATNYDWVTFNSLNLTGPVTPPIAVPSPYTADGTTYNPIGLTNDFEVDICGPGGGSQATLFAADATLGLAYWNGAAYVSVPSAFSYGGETGETATGANVAWSNAPGGPFSTYGTVTTGPSVLTGLWNASAPVGSTALTFDVTPTNAFVIVDPMLGSGAGDFSANFTVSEAAVAPTATNGGSMTISVIPGNYSFLVELSGYDALAFTADIGFVPTIYPIVLTADPSTGVYTPLWAFSNAEVGMLATSGAGTTASPYVMPNSQAAPLSSVFGLYNDYTFPVYPGVFFMDTSATTEFVDAASLNTSTNTFQFPGADLPSTNALQYWFWNVSNVAVLNSTISGWFGTNAYYPLVFDTYNVVFYESSHNLIAGDTFNTEGGALLFFSGGTFFGPLNVGGGDNTIWGSVFYQVAVNDAACPNVGHCEALDPVFAGVLPLGLGLMVAESNDLIYNNAFYTDTTAYQLSLNLYSGFPDNFTNTWNIAPVPGSVVNTVPNFPAVQLTGDILGPGAYVNGLVSEKGWQGGNFWWDYGGMPFGGSPNPYNGAVNVFGVLPYDENGYAWSVYIYGPSYYFASFIYNGGDFAPIVPFTLWTVTFHTVGLPAGDSWDLQLYGYGSLWVNTTTTATNLNVYLPNGVGGAYAFFVSTPYGYVASPASSPNLNVNNHNGAVTITFSKVTYSVTFVETGLTLKQLAKGWTVVFGGTARKLTSPSTTFIVMNGSIPYLIAGPGGMRVSGMAASGTITVAGLNLTEPFSFVKGATYTLSFGEKGLAKGTSWCVSVGGLVQCTTKGSDKFLNLTPGTYAYVIEPVAGYTLTAKLGGGAIPLSGTLSVTKGTTVSVKAVA
ncbi:MAG TPA: thermopsin family protease [Thermoplasmata archaeon]|nr:thermopsin family protease [Thermoplasmata archaeon]